ncbi:phosphoribosylanthranilate isomerase [Paenibacillus nasutitermitis]|uniref:N-(5'-phosphoribosyl)anthranilate isomerase n=1 Tax=Paenibacillus nasutitermitis TaxID=1652958 RepID=A0A916YZX2_9BACL|nr:phosphoribosylanthranilate isomerase [Paenibacillus nasutitermitis]GGD69146.1 N-(5'-phosphoribosyl)anthranilate isomerase [Paenibacillus nasutitermitis]
MSGKTGQTGGTRVKICGLRDAGTIRLMDGLPVDEIGFVFAASRRQVEPELAADLLEQVRGLHTPAGKAPRTVGVFVDADLESLRETLAIAPLDVVQLHGNETPEFCAAVKAELGVDVWKVLGVLEDKQQRTGEAGEEGGHADGPGRLAAYRGAVDAILIDTAGGGTGRSFAWHVIDGYRTAAREIGVPLYVAGGLYPDNVGQLLGIYSPDGVDVSSGVETDGLKDIEKIRLFVERVKGI